MFNQIKIEGLRGISDLDIGDFKQINLFVGKNNCGKTTILESLFLLIGISNPELPVRINTFRDFFSLDDNSWRLIFNNLSIDGTIKITGHLKNPKEKRTLLIKPKRRKAEHESAESSLTAKISHTGILHNVNGLEIEFACKADTAKSKKFKTEIFVSDGKRNIISDENYAETRNGVFINPKTISADIARRFDRVQIAKNVGKITGILRDIEPSIESLVLGNDGIVYCDAGLDRLIPMNVMGDGLFRVLAVVLGIYDTRDGIVLIDEIENGLHHSTQRIVWDAILKSAKEFNVQVFATTHSIECVQSFCDAVFNIDEMPNTARLYRIEKKGPDYTAIKFDKNNWIELPWKMKSRKKTTKTAPRFFISWISFCATYQP